MKNKEHILRKKFYSNKLCVYKGLNKIKIKTLNFKMLISRKIPKF